MGKTSPGKSSEMQSEVGPYHRGNLSPLGSIQQIPKLGTQVSFPQYQLNPKISGKLVPGVPKCAGATVDPKTYSQSQVTLGDMERFPHKRGHMIRVQVKTQSSSSVQSLSHVQLFATSWTAARQASLSITNSWNLLKFMSIDLVMPSNHLILCCPLLFLPSIFLSIRVFSNESALHIRWQKYQSFSFSISPSNEYSGFISFRMNWLDLLAVQETLQSLLQNHSSKASILRHSAFLTAQFSHPYMTTGKTVTLTRRTFVGKAMSLLFNMLGLLQFFFQGTSIY